MPLEVSKDGFAEINKRIDAIEERASLGLMNFATAGKHLSEIRSEVFGLRKTLKDVLVIVKDASGTNGPSAA